MKHCSKCNLDFPDNYKFCGSCGGPIDDARSCPTCHELVEGKWTFCTNCGSSLSADGPDEAVVTSEPLTPAKIVVPLPAQTAAPSSTRQNSAPATFSLPAAESPSNSSPEITAALTTHEWYSAPDLFEETTATHPAPPIPSREMPPPTLASSQPLALERNVRGERSAPTLTMLAAYGEPEAPSNFQWWHGAALGLSVILLLGGLGFAGWYWWTHRGAVAQTNPTVDSNSPTDAANPANSPTAKPASTLSSGQPTSSRAADDEVRRLREKRLNSKPAESGQIIAAFDDAEKKYPTEYRLPYERAKLSIKGVTSHHEAFSALAGAAEKAIDNGKSQEMLDGLSADKDGDFYKLSRGHREWQTLIDALGKKDKRLLGTLHH